MRDALEEKAAELERRGIFLGGPLHKFVRGGRCQLEVLLQNGLTPNDRVVDVGCGCLRGGWWIINFLRPGRYFGIEPNRQMLEAGIDVMLGPDLLAEKQPQFSNTDDFDLTVFAATFEFAIARSVWTHASRDQIRTMLRSFLKCSHKHSLIVASILPPGEKEKESAGTAWVGKSHISQVEGMAKYSLATVRNICREEGYEATPLDIGEGQRWLLVKRDLQSREPSP